MKNISDLLGYIRNSVSGIFAKRKLRMESPELPEAHVKHTGNKWIDTLLACSAILISAVSIAVSIHHGKIMEKLVAAQAWPNVDFENSNTSQDKQVISLQLRNSGSGPARIEAFSLSYKGKEVNTWVELMNACCLANSEKTDDPVRMVLGSQFVTGVPEGRVALPGDKFLVLSLARDEQNDLAWRKLNEERFRISARACYCSVFDECYVTEFDQKVRPYQVDACLDESSGWRG